MAKEILNRVKNSGIMTIDFDDLLVPNIFEIDLKNWLVDDLFLVEKKFRDAIIHIVGQNIRIPMFVYFVAMMLSYPNGPTCLFHQKSLM